MLDVIYNGNEPALLALSAEELNVDVDFLTQLKETHFSYKYLSEENSPRWKNLQSFHKAKNGIFFRLERFIWNLLNNIPRVKYRLTNNILVDLSLRGRVSMWGSE